MFIRNVMHPGRKFLCNECGRELANNNSLKVHKRAVHQKIKIEKKEEAAEDVEDGDESSSSPQDQNLRGESPEENVEDVFLQHVKKKTDQVEDETEERCESNDSSDSLEIGNDSLQENVDDDSTMQENVDQGDDGKLTNEIATKWLNEPKKKRERRSLKPKIENKIENSNTSLDNSNASFDNTNTSLNEENNHDCDICGLEHKSGKAMMSHRQALHPGRKFLCRDCGKEFSLNANMKVHRRSLHQQVKIPCEQCGSQFTNRSNFNVHAKKFHPA